MNSFKGTILITGAGHGIGAATAKQAAREGYAVCVHYKSRTEEAEQVKNAICTDGGTAIAVQADIADPAQVEALFEAIGRDLPPLRGLVNNAAAEFGAAPLQDMPRETLEDILGVNVLGAMDCIQHAVRRMGTGHGHQGGTIVNVSSQAAIYGGNNITAYAASKAAVNTLTIGLARELASEKISVNAVSPGPIETETFMAKPTDQRDRMLASMPMGRFGTPEEIAAIVIWLMTDAPQFLTGTIIPAAGGR
jgi:NAD(P)-dependent dehydrogenase (short-subunit alcohol dehydrogenase family)